METSIPDIRDPRLLLAKPKNCIIRSRMLLAWMSELCKEFKNEQEILGREDWT